MRKSQEASQRALALHLYKKAFQDAEMSLPENWIDRFLQMWDSPAYKDVSIPPAPPCGWEDFNTRLGGVPWHGAYDHDPQDVP